MVLRPWLLLKVVICGTCSGHIETQMMVLTVVWAFFCAVGVLS